MTYCLPCGLGYSQVSEDKVDTPCLSHDWCIQESESNGKKPQSELTSDIKKSGLTGTFINPNEYYINEQKYCSTCDYDILVRTGELHNALKE